MIFTASAEEGQLNCPNVRFHVDPQATRPLVTPSRDDWTDAGAMLRTMPLNGSPFHPRPHQVRARPVVCATRLVPRFDLDHVARDVIEIIDLEGP